MSPHFRNVLAELVMINTDTQNIEGLETARSILRREFDQLGFNVRIESENGRKLLIAESSLRPLVTFLGHIDTVFPANEPTQPLSEDDQYFYGDGVIDMKGGIVLMMQVLSELPQELRSKIKIVINDEEETGSTKLRNILSSELRNSGPILVFEPGLKNGDLVSSQNGVAWFEIDVQGKSAHAGLEPQNGYNACVELSNKAVHMSELTDLQSGISVNVGTLTGGTKPNVVCENAKTRVDLRFVEKHQFEKLTTSIGIIAETFYHPNTAPGFEPASSVKRLAYLPALSSTSSNRLIALALTVSKRLGIEIHHQHVGYGSDGGIGSETGAEVIVGLGPFGEGMHTRKEALLKKSFLQRVLLTKALVQVLTKEVN